jgi:hypothetical protein
VPVIAGDDVVGLRCLRALQEFSVARIEGHRCASTAASSSRSISLPSAPATNFTRPRTRSSNPVRSSAESANYRFRTGLPTLGSDRQQPVGL